MADKPFDRATAGNLEKPQSVDINRQSAQIDRTLRDLLQTMIASRASDSSDAPTSKSGFLSTGFRPAPSAIPAMTLVVNSGTGFIYDPTDVPSSIGGPDLVGISDLSTFKPIVLAAPVTLNVPAAPGAPNSRIDLIEVRTDRVLRDLTSRLQLVSATRSFTAKDFYKTLSFALDGDTGTVTSPTASTAAISYKTGVAANPGVAPAVTTGYTAIAYVNVPNSTATITGDQIVDARPLLFPSGMANASIRYRLQWNAGAPIVTLKSVCAPPNVLLTVALKMSTGAGFTRGTATVCVFGGAMLKCNIVGTTVIDNTATKVLVPVAQNIYSPNNVGAWTDTAQAAESFHTPAPAIGIGQAHARIQVSANAFTTPAAGDADDIEVDLAMHIEY